MSELMDSFVNSLRDSDLITGAEQFNLSSVFSTQEHKLPSTKMRIVASSLYKNLVGDFGFEGFIKLDKDTDSWKECFDYWKALLEVEALSENTPWEFEDLLQLSASGLVAQRPTDVKNALSSVTLSFVDSIDSAFASNINWPELLRDTISKSIVTLIKQRNLNDLRESESAISTLTELQAQFENEWIEEKSPSHSQYYIALGLYHIAHATLRLSQFLKKGFVLDSKGYRAPLKEELRRVLIKANEYFDAASSPEFSNWGEYSSICLNELYSSSIWANTSGISALFDDFVTSLASEEKASQIFSLLPSQREAIQSSLLDSAKIAVVLQMPTSAGKTLLAEFSIIQTLEAFGRESKIIYLAPTRALVTQTKNTFVSDFSSLNINVFQTSSAFEEDPYELALLESQNGIVVSTPEKADLLFRSHNDWFSDVKLIVIDEAHLLGDGERGARLELFLANVRREHPNIRLLLLTPFVKNAEMISEWLGGDRGIPLSVSWRPTKTYVGITRKQSEGKRTSLVADWKVPHSKNLTDFSTHIESGLFKKDVKSTRAIVNRCAKSLKNSGTVLAMFPTSPKEAEFAAFEMAESLPLISNSSLTPELRFAAAYVESEYGADSKLAYCLRRGVAYHHASLSPELRFLIEDQVKTGAINYIAATSTLAQGMNFPVASVIVHSVHKPRGAGDLSSGEFWNIAGRAGRVGLSNRGLVLFANPEHREKWKKYTSSLDQPISSALKRLLSETQDGEVDLKELYRNIPEIRPFLQYFSHSASLMGVEKLKSMLVELINSSLLYKQTSDLKSIKMLRSVTEQYVEELANKNRGYLKIADSTGLGTFSFDRLIWECNNSDTLSKGLSEVERNGEAGVLELLNAFKWIPEFNLSIDNENVGNLNLSAIAKITSGWINGASIKDLAKHHPSKHKSEEAKVNSVGKYVFSTVSQRVSWGAHAFSKAHALGTSQEAERDVSLLPSFLQFGVNTPEATVASILGIPRVFAKSIGQEYRNEKGVLTKDSVNSFKSYVEDYDSSSWQKAARKTQVAELVSTSDIIHVLKKLQGK